MIDIESLNVNSPYTLCEIEGKEGLYKFTTNFGVKYIIGFIPDDSIVCGAYQFVILNTNNKPSPNDSNIKNVVTLLLDAFFEQNEEALIYIYAKLVTVSRLSVTDYFNNGFLCTTKKVVLPLSLHQLKTRKV